MAQKCDCLNFCGDDPRIRDGRAEPCEGWKKQEAELKEHRRLKALIIDLPADTIERLKKHRPNKKDHLLAADALSAAKTLFGANNA
jgi:hypothetical protein